MYEGGPNDGKVVPYTEAGKVAIKNTASPDKDSIALYERDAEGRHKFLGKFTPQELCNHLQGGLPSAKEEPTPKKESTPEVKK